MSQASSARFLDFIIRARDESAAAFASAGSRAKGFFAETAKASNQRNDGWFETVARDAAAQRAKLEASDAAFAKRKAAAAEIAATKAANEAARLNAIKSESQALQFQLEGQFLNAEIVRLEAHYATRIAMATTAAERQALTTQLGLAKNRVAQDALVTPDAPKGIGSLLNSSIKVGLIMAGIKASVGAIESGVEAWGARQSELNGDIEAAHAGYMKTVDAIKGIPIAGDIAARLVNVFTGWDDDIAKATDATSRMNRELEKVRDRAKEVAAALAESRNRERDSRQGESLVGVEGFTREKMEAQNQAQKEQEKALELIKQSQNKSLGDNERAKLLEQGTNEFDAAGAKFQRAMANIRAREQQSLKDRDKRIGDELDSFFPSEDDMRDRSQRLADLDAQLKQQQLENEGKHWDAMRAARKAEYDKQIAEAEALGDREMAAKLRGVRDAAVAGVDVAMNKSVRGQLDDFFDFENGKPKTETSRLGGSNPQGRLLTGVSQASNEGLPLKGIEKNTAKQTEIADASRKELAGLLRDLLAEARNRQSTPLFGSA